MSINLQSWVKTLGINCTLERLTGVTEAWLGYNGIKELPTDLFKLNLTDLHLYNNKISELPTDIFELKNLKFLSIDDNRLTNLPESIIELSKLEVITASYNHLTSLPELGVLKELRLLKIDHNKLTSIPKSLCERIMETNIRVYADHNKLSKTSINGADYIILNNEYLYQGRIKFQQELDKSKIKHASELSNYHQ